MKNEVPILVKLRGRSKMSGKKKKKVPEQKEIVEAYLDEKLDELGKKGVLGEFDVDSANQTLERLAKERDPVARHEQMAKVYGGIQRSVAYSVGVRVDPSVTNISARHAIGSEYLDDYKMGRVTDEE